MEIENYDFGQIFRLEHKSGVNDWYILAVVEQEMFILANLVWGSKMSDAMMYPRSGSGVPVALVEQHAAYFIDRGCKLIPVTDCKMSYLDMPRPLPGEANIGVQA
jgi:hypothetical protein